MPALDTGYRGAHDDDGSAEPGVQAALAAYGDGQGSEHAALTTLARARLLVPVVSVLTEASVPDETAVAAGARQLKREKSSEMALPTLIGRDGRSAVLAFTCLDALARWRPDARPIPGGADRVWRAAADECGAVVLDVAGPVPLAIEGARLAALAAGAAVPPPHEDPDAHDAVLRAVADEPAVTGVSLSPASEGADIAVRLRVALPPDADEAARTAAVSRAAAGIATQLGGRFRRGIEITVIPEFPVGTGN
jgi:hypothetical protein